PRLPRRRHPRRGADGPQAPLVEADLQGAAVLRLLLQGPVLLTTGPHRRLQPVPQAHGRQAGRMGLRRTDVTPCSALATTTTLGRLPMPASQLTQLTHNDPEFYPTLGPYLASREVSKFVGDNIWDDEHKTWYVL